MTIPQYLSLTEAAERLGYADSNTLRLWSREGRIPGAQKIGAQWVVPVSWVVEQEKIGKPKRGGPRGKGVRSGSKNK
jgi:predicted site-specific integrase-resolvase